MTSMASYMAGEMDALNEVELVAAGELNSKGYPPIAIRIGGLYGLSFNTIDPNSA